MVTPVLLGFGGGPKITQVVQASSAPVPPALTPPGPGAATEATKTLLRDLSSQRSYQTTVLTRLRDHLIPGANNGLFTGAHGYPEPSGNGGLGGGSNYTPTDPTPPAPTTNVTPPADFVPPTGPGRVDTPPFSIVDESTDPAVPPDVPNPIVGDPPPVDVSIPNVVDGSIRMPATEYPGFNDPAPTTPTGNNGLPSDLFDIPPVNPVVPEGTVNMPATQFLGEASPSGSSSGPPSGNAYDNYFAPGSDNYQNSGSSPYDQYSTDWTQGMFDQMSAPGTVNMPATEFLGPVYGPNDMGSQYYRPPDNYYNGSGNPYNK